MVFFICSSIETFINIDEQTWIDEMKTRFRQTHNLPLDDSQIRAWKDCFQVLQEQLPQFAEKYPFYNIIFEYVLPYESGRRPDVMLISKAQILVLEFKQKFTVYHADIDQTIAYARDIREYHYESRNIQVDAILVLTKTDELSEDFKDIPGLTICCRDELGEVLNKIALKNNCEIDVNQWLDSRYEPLPTIVEAAKMFVHHEELPNIRRVNSTCIPQAIECLKEVSSYAKEQKKHVVAFVTGVPGAGKTFLGLQYVYDICDDYENVNSVYLSGNGPLVAVLTEALHSSVFIKDLHKIVNQYLSDGAKDFHNNIVVLMKVSVLGIPIKCHQKETLRSQSQKS